MKHLVSIVFCCFFIAGCSSVPKHSGAETPKFLAPSVELTLQQKLVHDDYPDQSALTDLLQSRLAAALQAQGALADANNVDALAVSISMQYRRVFAGEATPIPSSSVAPPVVNYKVVVTRSSSPITTYERQNLTVNRGFGQNLLGLFTFGLGNTPQTEADDADTLARAIARELTTNLAAQ